MVYIATNTPSGRGAGASACAAKQSRISNQRIRVGANDAVVDGRNASTPTVRCAQIPLKKPLSIPSEGGSSRCFPENGWKGCFGGSLAAIRALCRQHFRKHIDRSQAGEPPEVLGGRRKEEFVLSSVWSSQTQTCQTKDSLEVSE